MLLAVPDDVTRAHLCRVWLNPSGEAGIATSDATERDARRYEEREEEEDDEERRSAPADDEERGSTKGMDQFPVTLPRQRW